MATPGLLTPSVDEVTVPVPRWISLQAELLRNAVADGEPAAMEVLRFAGVTDAAVPLSIETARLAAAKDHWYSDWVDALAHGADRVDTRFEAAADAIHAGDVDTLRRLLEVTPDLATMRSPFPHRQTLIHHVSANGIEIERQYRLPATAVEVLRTLLDAGADPDAVCQSYGGGSGTTPLCLLVSSAGPAAAGTQAGLVEALCHGGASVNGIDDDGLPLWTAITFGYTAAVEALARSGARIDNLCFAAALGDLHLVESAFGPDGRLRPDSKPVGGIGATGPALRQDQLVDYALIWAAAHGRLAVVEFLLTKNPDLTVTEPRFRSSALSAARYHGRDQVVALLEPLTAGRLVR